MVRKAKIFFVLMIFLLATVSCKKQVEAVVDTDEIMLSVLPADEKDSEGMDNGAMWSSNEGLVCIMFGYGFNSESFRKETLSLLDKEYGLAENGGIIWPLVYPDDFRNRIMNLYDLVNEQNIRGIILLGAPERTHYALAKLQDDWDGFTPYSIFSFFPQDDILGEESTSHFVLEYTRGITDEANEGETELKIDEDAEEILSRAVKYIMDLPSPLASDSELFSHVQFIAGNRKVRHYIDSETGLHAVNHFVMEEQK